LCQLFSPKLGKTIRKFPSWSSRLATNSFTYNRLKVLRRRCTATKSSCCKYSNMTRHFLLPQQFGSALYVSCNFSSWYSVGASSVIFADTEPGHGNFTLLQENDCTVRQCSYG
jgi:hypothetical protein